MHASQITVAFPRVPVDPFVRSYVRPSRHRTVLSATVHETLLVRRPEFQLSGIPASVFKKRSAPLRPDTFPRSWTAKESNRWLFPFRDTKRYLTRVPLGEPFEREADARRATPRVEFHGTSSGND